MERLLSGVREIARIDAQLEAEARRPVALDGLLPTIVEGFRLRAATTGSRVELELRAGAGPRCAASPERLTPGLREPARQRAVASRRRAARSRSSSAVARRAGRWSRSPTTGPGIPPEHLDAIFDRFFTCRPDESQARSGHTRPRPRHRQGDRRGLRRLGDGGHPARRRRRLHRASPERLTTANSTRRDPGRAAATGGPGPPRQQRLRDRESDRQGLSRPAGFRALDEAVPRASRDRGNPGERRKPDSRIPQRGWRVRPAALAGCGNF